MNLCFYICHVYFQWIQQDLEFVGQDFFSPQSWRRFGICPLSPSWTINTVQPEFTGGRGVCWPWGLWCPGLGSGKVEGGRRKRSKGIVEEIMTFLNPDLADRDTCYHAIITMTERENLFYNKSWCRKELQVTQENQDRIEVGVVLWILLSWRNRQWRSRRQEDWGSKLYFCF